MNYSDELKVYLETIKKFEPTQSFASDRLEAHFECLKDRSLMGDLKAKKEWFESERKKCQMKVTDIPLNQCRDWIVDQSTGNVKHKSGEFFKIHGIRVVNSNEREVSNGWDQPILTQIGFDGGLLGIIRKRINGVPHYLLEAKAEPGNYGLVLLSPTLQATFSNLKRAHGGNKPRYAEYFEHPEQFPIKVLFSKWLSEDGGRLMNKRNHGMLIEVDDSLDLKEPESFNWFSLWQIKELLSENAWVNPHIRGILCYL